VVYASLRIGVRLVSMVGDLGSRYSRATVQRSQPRSRRRLLRQPVVARASVVGTCAVRLTPEAAGPAARREGWDSNTQRISDSGH